MPLNILRLNHAPSSYPNERIAFIKPLPRPPNEQHIYETADTFLRAIAAQCLPIMKSHYLSVTTLEEHEPNPEFIGRNFNNGEIIQLVLRGKNGGWVPFNMVQMVMMHELAHNTHMNHGKGFWATRNKFAGELRGLWDKNYTGDGFWGSGRVVGDLRAVVGNNSMNVGDMQDMQVCGGTFRSRRRKRKRAHKDDGQELTWKEKHDRRIEKKFGKSGQSLGEDEGQRMLLEIGKKGLIGGKPRVAQSKRGRELRAAAALARFDTNKKNVKKLEDEEESGDEYEEDVSVKGEDVRDVNGQRLLDSMGFGMVKVCEEENGDDANVKNEVAELERLGQDRASFQHQDETRHRTREGTDLEGLLDQATQPANPNPLYDIPEYKGSPTPPSSPVMATSKKTANSKPKISIKRPLFSKVATSLATATTIPPETTNPEHWDSPDMEIDMIPDFGNTGIKVREQRKKHAAENEIITKKSCEEVRTAVPSPKAETKEEEPQASPDLNCPVCSLENNRDNAICIACSHVLDTSKDPRHWRCGNDACKDSEYVNSGDAGMCAACGERKD